MNRNGTGSRPGGLVAAPLLCALLAWPAIASAQTAARVAAPPGKPVSVVIDDWRRQGVPFAYSTELLDDSIVVLAEPVAREPEAMVTEILAPHGLRLIEIEGLLVVGRAEAPPQPRPTTAAPSRPETDATAPPVPEVTVSASRYELLRELIEAPSFISQRTLQQLPLLGEDPLRAVQRLPGNAASGASAKSHLRGGAERDTGLVLNGQRLLDPYHVRDYHNLFSAIDSRAVSGVEVYTGGFPARYGDGTGGLVVIDTITPDSDRHTEIGLSVYNTSFLSAGRAAGGDLEWLLSARRGNLDLVLDAELGEPSYNDVFAEVGIHLSPETSLSVNALVATDDVLAVTETDPEERESSTNETRNAQIWVNWRQEWGASLASHTTLSISALNSDRTGSANDPEEIIASVEDRRNVDVWGLRQDWTFDVGDRHRLSWGASWRHAEAAYRYRGSVDYIELFARFRDRPDSIRRSVDSIGTGDSVGVYLSDRLKIGDGTYAELGLRWDWQKQAGESHRAQFSPRFSLLHRLRESTDLRLSVGRYYQAQGADGLDVVDGVTTWYPAERADQVAVGLEQQLGESLAFRLEAYYKHFGNLRPRYENLLDPLAVMPELKPDRVRIHADGARARGLELSLGNEGRGAWNWWLSWALSDAEDRVAGEWVPRSWDQRHAGQLGILWQNERWEASFVVSAHSGWPKTAVRIAPDSDPDDPQLEFTARNGGQFATFATLDLRLAHRRQLEKGELTLFFELSNATDRNNPCCVDIEIDDEVSPAALLQNDEYWFPVLPAFGVLWEF